MRSLRAVESTDLDIDLEASQAEALALLGKRLASTKGWWGDDIDDAAEVSKKSVIAVQPHGGGRYGVRVVDAVGIIAVHDLQIVVEPKIPISHLLYLFARSGQLPRAEEQQAQAETASDLWELVATWFVGQAERVLRTGLILDYHAVTDELRFMRGQLHTLETANSYYSGRLEFACRFDEFGLDTPLNRILLAAARMLVTSERLPIELRRRGRRIIARLDGVGDLTEGDLRSTVDRRTAHYRDAITLGRNILLYQGRTLAAGNTVAWTFLIRTPEMVEAGIRRVLQDGLGIDRVTKKGIGIRGAKLTFNPDLVFDGGHAVGDVKYKLADGTWNRPDLYQSIAFAEAYGTNRSVVIRFASSGVESATELTVGSKTVSELTWPADPTSTPFAAADTLVAAVAEWLLDGQAAGGRELLEVVA